MASIFPIVNYQEKAEAAYTPAVTTLSITSASNIASIDIAPNSANGTFASTAAADEIAFSVTTDNLTGYQLNILGNDATGGLNNTSYGDTLDSITAATDAATFENGASATYSNKWGIKPSKLNSAANTDFIPAPTTSTDIIMDVTSAPNAVANTYTIGLGARVNYTKPSGTYTNTFNIQAVGRQITYAITYKDNSGDATVANIPAAEGQADVTVSEFTLPSTVPTRTYWVFAGWCDGTATYPAANKTACSGTVYQPGDSYTFATLTPGASNSVDLYAMWRPSYIQDYTNSQCSSEASSASRLVLDKRDNEVYAVRYINGRCWMTQNLRFTGSVLTPADSNVATTKNMTYHEALDGNFTTDARIHTGIDSGGNVSVWYNNYAATAGTISGDSTTADAAYDICPAGWRLPTRNEFAYLLNDSSGFNPVRGGVYHNGALVEIDVGRWWASTGNTNYPTYGYRYYLQYGLTSTPTSTDYTLGDNAQPGAARYIRCIKKVSSFNEITSLQAFGSIAQNDRTAVIGSMTANTNYSLTDRRDSQTYTIAKLASNRVWMTKNLAIGCSGASRVTRTLTYLNSNVNSSWSTSNAKSLDKNDGTTGCTTSSTTDCNTNTSSRMKCNATYGAWYNYVGATAGTITGDSNSDDAIYDICPLGWAMPKRTEITSIAASTYVNFFKVAGGVYNNGAIAESTYGRWWSSTATDATYRPFLYYNSSNTTLSSGTNAQRPVGRYVRCILKN